MHIDRSRPEPTPPKAPPWDNTGLGDRLEGQAVDDPDLEGLHAIARERNTAPEKRKRSRLFRR
jgi:hypothetical protein